MAKQLVPFLFQPIIGEHFREQWFDSCSSFVPCSRSSAACFSAFCHDQKTSILDAHLTIILYLIRALCAANIPCFAGGLLSRRHLNQLKTERQDKTGGFGALRPPATILRNTKQKGLPHPEQPLFSGKLERFCNPKVVGAPCSQSY